MDSRSGAGSRRGRVWRGARFSFDLDKRALVMGIVNVTPDSFSGDGVAGDPDAAVAHGLALAEAGADLLDVGGESTRPGSERVGEEVELARVLPVIERLAARTRVPISVDTMKARVAREALEAGAAVVNDVSGFRFDPGMAAACAEAGAGCVLMHMRGEPKTMQSNPVYEDLLGEVKSFLAGSIQIAERAGIEREQIAVDPGIGFGKTFDHNLILLRRLAELRDLGCAVLVGPSRKAFLGHLLGGAPPDRRLAGTAAAAVAAVLAGADVVRVHDVAFVAQAVRVASAIRGAGSGGEASGV